MKYSGPTVIVSGLPRSGTSMMMQMLGAGGIKPLEDGIRQADKYNPCGYYEIEKVGVRLQFKTLWEQARSRAIKVTSNHLGYFGTPLDLFDVVKRYPLVVIFMLRDLKDVLSSQNDMLVSPKGGFEYMRSWQQINESALQALATYNIPFLNVHYTHAIQNPRQAAEELKAFLGWSDFDVDAAAQAVKPELNHFSVIA